MRPTVLTAGSPVRCPWAKTRAELRIASQAVVHLGSEWSPRFSDRYGLRSSNLTDGPTMTVEDDWWYPRIEATYVKVGQNGRIGSVAVIVAENVP